MVINADIRAMDTSKQAIAASIVHFTNILLAKLPQSITAEQNPCVWYFLNLGLDCSVGVYILYVALQLLNSLFNKIGVTGILLIDVGLVMGQYGNPPQFYSWFKQLLLFLMAWSLVKFIVALSLYLIPIFGIIGGWILEPIKNDPRAQIVFVMFVFPLAMNILQVFAILTRHG